MQLAILIFLKVFNIFHCLAIDVRLLTKDGELFQLYRNRIASALGIPNATDEELWNLIPDAARSYRRKCGFPKSSRWFSWNEQFEEQFTEWWISRMMLHWYFQDSLDGLLPEDVVRNDRGQTLKFSQLFAKASGLKLGFTAIQIRPGNLQP